MTGREPSGAVGKKPVLKRDEALVVKYLQKILLLSLIAEKIERKQLFTVSKKEREDGTFQRAAKPIEGFLWN